MSSKGKIDPEFSEELVAHRQAIYHYIRSIVREPAEAEDLTQDTLLRAYKKLPTLKDPTRLLSWLYRIATNACRDRIRQTARRDRPHSLDVESNAAAASTVAETVADDAPRLDKVMEREEMSECVQDYLAKLSDSYRAAILLHDAEGLTASEIATLLDVPLSTVKIRLHRARNKLRTALGEGCTFSNDERGVYVCEPKSKAPKK